MESILEKLRPIPVIMDHPKREEEKNRLGICKQENKESNYAGEVARCRKPEEEKREQNDDGGIAFHSIQYPMKNFPDCIFLVPVKYRRAHRVCVYEQAKTTDHKDQHHLHRLHLIDDLGLVMRYVIELSFHRSQKFLIVIRRNISMYSGGKPRNIWEADRSRSWGSSHDGYAACGRHIGHWVV